MNKKHKLDIDLLRNTVRSNKRVIAYVISGVFALAIDYIIFLLFLYALNAPLSVSVAAGLTSGLIASFSLNKKWTFKSDSRHRHSGGKQLILYILLFVFNNFFTYLFIRLTLLIGIIPLVSKMLATICITLWNYVLYKKVIFR
ncbi:GtrA family protein [Candidatus Saccharibacteria bacterium]|nr:MAG: GtrA family protein [Candidatus Saccharibacteria bacterium]